MPAYTHGEYFHFNNIIDAPKEHNNEFILNKETDFYITSPLKFIDEAFIFLPKLFVDKMIKMD